VANIARFPALDAATAQRAEDFIEGNLPNVFFQAFNPFEVVQREEELMAGGVRLPPHADLDLLRLVIGLRPAGVAPVTCVGMLTAVAGNRVEWTEWVKRIFVERIDDRATRVPAQPRAASVVLRELVGGLIRDRKAPTQTTTLWIPPRRGASRILRFRLARWSLARSGRSLAGAFSEGRRPASDRNRILRSRGD
jgi:hypothetical protein